MSGIGSTYPTDPFSAFIANAPLADTPGTSDVLALIQNKVTKRLPVGNIPGLAPIVKVPTNILPSGTSSYAIKTTDYFIGINNNPAISVALSLPNAPGAGLPVIVKDISGLISPVNAITISGGTIDGQSSYTIAYPDGWVWLESTGIGNNWAIIGQGVGSGTFLITTAATYSLPASSGFIGVNLGIAAAITLNLPSSPSAGVVLTIKDVAGNCSGTTPITVSNGTVDGQSGFILPFAYSWVTVRSLGIGNNWAIVSRWPG